MKRLGFLILLTWMSGITFLSAQSTLAGKSTHSTQSTLADHFQTLVSTAADSVKQAANAQLIKTLQAEMLQKDGFEKVYTGIQNLGSIYSDDHSLRILSWNYRLENGLYAYSCVWVKAPEGFAPAKVAAFTCASAIKPNRADRYNANNWYGALYYNAFAYKNYYIILGYSQYNPATQVKCIEVLDWTQDQPVLGKSIFEKKGRISSRVVFEYGSNAQMRINHIPEEKQLVFDHLSPAEPNLAGIYSYYGPDFSYDAYELKRNTWIFIEDIDIKNEP